MVYSVYVKEQILILATQGFKPPTIQKILAEERFYVTREGVHKFITKFNESGSLLRRPGYGRPSKTTLEVKRVVEEQMRLDDETTAYQLHALLNAKGYFLFIHTIFRCRSALGLTFRGSAYCQLIRQVNKEKRLEWAQKYKDDSFADVIYTDECTVQLESHRRFCCRKKGEAPRPKPRPKHPVKVHVWAGISL